jgi:hypothetical protein
MSSEHPSPLCLFGAEKKVSKTYADDDDILEARHVVLILVVKYWFQIV